MYYKIDNNNQIIATYSSNTTAIFLADIDTHITVQDFANYGIYQAIYATATYDDNTQKIAGYELEIINGIPTNVPQIQNLSAEEIAEKIVNKRQNMIVSMRQTRLTLLQIGLLSSVDAVIDQLPEPTKSAARIEWEYAQQIKRLSPLVLSLLPALGLNDLQADDLFYNASLIGD